MELIRIISNVDDEGRLHIPEGLTLKKGRVEVIIKHLDENKEKIRNRGGQILTSTHIFGGIGRAVRKRFNTYQVDEIIAATLKTFGQGTKVAVEIVLAAADAGLISTKEDVISIGGSGRGADTALVISPTNVIDFFDIKIREIICKPIM